MSGRQSPPKRSPEYVWLITGMLTVVAVVFSVVLALRHEGWEDHWLAALLALPFFVVLGMGLQYVQIRRHGATLSLHEIALVIAFFFLPAVLVVFISTIAMAIKQFRLYRRRPALDKLAFNAARAGAAAATAGIVLEVLPPITGTGPRTWVILALAVTVQTVVTLLAVAAVMTAVQGLQAGLETLRVGWVVLSAAEVCIVIGLVFTIALKTTWWSAVLIFVLGGVLAMAYRSYSEFLRQH